MNICITVEADKAYKEVSDITLPVLRRYCDRHGYGLSVREEPTQSAGIIWERAFHMNQIDWTHAEAVWHFDADVLVTNHAIRLENFMPKSILISECKREDGSVHLNDGVFAASLYGARLLSAISTDEAIRQMQDVKCLQDALELRGFRGICDVLPQKCFNSFLYTEYGMPDTTPGHWTYGDFALHLPGRTNARRAEIFSGMIRDGRVIW